MVSFCKSIYAFYCWGPPLRSTCAWRRLAASFTDLSNVSVAILFQACNIASGNPTVLCGFCHPCQFCLAWPRHSLHIARLLPTTAEEWADVKARRIFGLITSTTSMPWRKASEGALTPANPNADTPGDGRDDRGAGMELKLSAPKKKTDIENH